MSKESRFIEDSRYTAGEDRGLLGSSKNPGPEDPALIHPRGVWFIKPAPKEVMTVFSRPYLKKNSTEHCGHPIFGVCAHGPL